MADTHGQGDTLAQADDYKEPRGLNFGVGTWKNRLIGEDTWDEKSKRGGEEESASKPVVTISTETSATSADSFVFTGEVEDSFSQISMLTYELTGGNTTSGIIRRGNFLQRTSPPFGGNWRMPSVSLAEGQTGLFVRGKNVKQRWGPWAFGTITRTPTASEEACSCDVFEDELTALTANWLQSGDGTMAQFTPEGWYHDTNEIGNITLTGQFDIGGDFDICCEVDMTQKALATANSGFSFELWEGVKGGAIAQMRIQGDGAGGLEYAITGNGIWTNGGNFGSIGIGESPNAILKFARVGTTLRAWTWNPITEQFEWDGNTDGATDSGTWDVDPSPFLVWFDNNPGAGDLTQGYVKKFCINTGVKLGP